MKETAHLTISILANALSDLTADFCDRFLSRRFRTYGWISDTSHLAKERINESYLQGTSLTGYLKLLEGAMASFRELTGHFESFLAQRELPLYSGDDQKLFVFKQFHIFILQGEGSPVTSVTSFIDCGNPAEYANLLRTLTQKELSLLDTQVADYRARLSAVPTHRPRLIRKAALV